MMRGQGVSPGIAVGHALVIERRAVPIFRMIVPPEALEGEVARLQRAIVRSREQLVAIRDRVSREVGRPHAYIFEAHLLMLDDPLLVERAVDVVRADHVNAEWALRTVSEQLRGLFEALSDPYLRERRTDLDDVQGRILLNLSGAGDAPSLSRLPGSLVVVADDLLPSEAAELDWDRVLAVATDQGSPTHHTSILARSLGIPAVVGLVSASRDVPPGALVVVDGSRGELVLEPSAPMLAGFRATQERDRREDEALASMRGVPCVTRDGTRIHLLANAEFPDEAATAVEHGAEGIGLFRSEYLLGRSGRWPSEEQQVEVYRGLLGRLREEIPDREARFEAYRALELPEGSPGVVNYRRLHQMEVRRLTGMDKQFGSGIGSFILENFQTRRLFHTTVRPNWEVFSLLMQFVAKLVGAAEPISLTESVDASLRNPQVPVHPKVARDLGVKWADERTHYLNRGRQVTWEGYIRSYIEHYG